MTIFREERFHNHFRGSDQMVHWSEPITASSYLSISFFASLASEAADQWRRSVTNYTTIWSDDKIFYTTVWLRNKIFAGNSCRWVLNLTEKIQIRIRQRKYRGQSDKEKQDKALGDFIQIIKYSQFKVSGTSCAFQPWEKGLHRLSDCRALWPEGGEGTLPNETGPQWTSGGATTEQQQTRSAGLNRPYV